MDFALIWMTVGTAVAAAVLVGDPTRSFFEDEPWRVPVTLVTLAAAAWAVLHFLGVTSVLLP